MFQRMIVVIGLIFSFQFGHAQQFIYDQPVIENGQWILEANDAGEVLSVSVEEAAAQNGANYMLNLVSFFNFKKSFETVSTYLTPTLEEAFDVFILVNVSYEKYGNSDAFIPSQHMRVLRKSAADQNVFIRNNEGVITGLYADVLGQYEEGAFKGLQGLMPVSSGASQNSKAGDPHVDTITGLYRVNHGKSTKQRYSKGMWHSMYYDLIYTFEKNRESGMAIHGTSKGEYKFLGTQKSHGCVRITQGQANVLYENLVLGETFREESLPDMDRTLRLKSELYQSGSLVTRGGQKALMVIFYGYDGQPGVQI